MKSVNGIKFQKLDFDQFRTEYLAIVANLRMATNFAELRSAIDSVNEKRNLWESMLSIAEINHFSDLSNEDFKAGVEFYESHESEIQALVKAYYSALVDSKFQNEIANEYGPQLLEIAFNECKLYNANIKDLQAEELKLANDFANIFYQIKYQIADQSFSADSIQSQFNSENRAKRKEAVAAQSKQLEELENSIASILIKITKLRNKIARACGFENFIEYSFQKMGRYNYGISDIENHRNGILKSLVPHTIEIRKRQAKRMNIPNLKFHDYPCIVPSKNLNFEFDSPDTIKKISKMFEELSPQTGDLFQKMKSSGLIEYKIEKNRMPGNFAFYVPQKKTPFLHTNFNGSKEDFHLLCHEFGHAFSYKQSNTEIPEYVYPFVEGAETQSIAMEFFCWNWIENFFGSNSQAYKYWHLSFELLYLPQLSLIDEFEQFLYVNEPQSIADIKDYWKGLELKYVPFSEYEEAPFFSEGGRYLTFANWFIDYPFWSICYSLAQISAFQFWEIFKTDQKKGWNKYLKFCKTGGRKSVLDSLKDCGILSPLAPQNIDSVLKNICKEQKSLEF